MAELTGCVAPNAGSRLPASQWRPTTSVPSYFDDRADAAPRTVHESAAAISSIPSRRRLMTDRAGGGMGRQCLYYASRPVATARRAVAAATFAACWAPLTQAAGTST